uniref:Uncharacterized protein n=1 Tax=Anopheles minimus TaxID=112268 RepID=A0A182WNH9_9DIPT
MGLSFLEPYLTIQTYVIRTTNLQLYTLLMTKLYMYGSIRIMQLSSTV